MADAEPDADADPAPAADAEDLGPELGIVADTDSDVGLQEIVPMEEVLEMGVGREEVMGIGLSSVAHGGTRFGLDS